MDISVSIWDWVTWTVKRRQTWPNPQTQRMQQTSGNTQTLEPKMLFWISNSSGENSSKNMRKDSRRWRWFGRWKEREEKIAPAQNESMKIGGLALSLLLNNPARWRSGKETALSIQTQDGGKSHRPASSRDLNRDLKTRGLCFRSLTILYVKATVCPSVYLSVQVSRNEGSKGKKSSLCNFLLLSLVAKGKKHIVSPFGSHELHVHWQGLSEVSPR